MIASVVNIAISAVKYLKKKRKKKEDQNTQAQDKKYLNNLLDGTKQRDISHN